MIAINSFAFVQSAQAADIRWNGFLSIVGGRVVNSEKLPDGSNTKFTADAPSNGTYGRHWDFEPDTIYGLQGIASLSDDLSATVQITGAGGKDFDANIRWAYLSYDINDTFTFQAGRQRIPFYKYSDSLDVAYTYDWVRPPTNLYQAAVDVFEGVKLIGNSSLGDWDTGFQLFAGKGDNFQAQTNGIFAFNNMLGVSTSMQNDWLEFRASYTTFDSTSENLSSGGESQGPESEGVGTDYLSLSASIQYNKGYVTAEWVQANLDDPLGADQGQGFVSANSWYISSGYRIKDITPYLTYGISQSTLQDNILFGGKGIAPDIEMATTSWIAGIRWDFHPRAAFKAEYTTRKDESDDIWVNAVGERFTVDVVSVGIDLLF